MGTVHAHEGKSHHFVRGKTNLAEGTRGSGCHAANKLCSQKKALHVGDGEQMLQGDLAMMPLPRKEKTLTHPNTCQVQVGRFLC